LKELPGCLARFLQKGKEQKSTIVLEAIADYQLWFWHAAFGFAGSLNDLNILNLSPFLTGLIDGTELEKEVTLCEISEESFDQLFVLVDGIYPQYSKFIHPWLQATNYRKGGQVASCLILHNMGVSDRVMGSDVSARYDPAANVADFSVKVRKPTDLLTSQRLLPDSDMARNGIRNGDQANINLLTRHERFVALKDVTEHVRLLNAIMNFTEGMTHPRVQKNNNNTL
jgi:Plant transposon protein